MTSKARLCVDCGVACWSGRETPRCLPCTKAATPPARRTPRPCAKCGKLCQGSSSGLCVGCYKRQRWQQGNGVCPGCGGVKTRRAKQCLPCTEKARALLAREAAERAKPRPLSSDRPQIYREVPMRVTGHCGTCGFGHLGVYGGLCYWCARGLPNPWQARGIPDIAAALEAVGGRVSALLTSRQEVAA